MKLYLVLTCGALLVGVLCVVFAAPNGNANDEAAPQPALYFPSYSISPPRILNAFPDIEDSSVSSSESSSEENDGVKPEGRTLFLILRLLQLLSQQNSTASG